jgi:hypothetical protein
MGGVPKGALEAHARSSHSRVVGVVGWVSHIRPALLVTLQLLLVIGAATLPLVDSAAHGQSRLGACGYYTDSAGNWVPRPCNQNIKPRAPGSDATAQCGDGTYSYNQHLEEACANHGGVVRFLP